jgi:RNA polymerase sigma-32 factor
VSPKYLRSVNSYPRLSAAKERELILDWRDHQNVAARDELLHSNIRYVAQVAWKYRAYKFPMDDLISEGTLGLLRALEKYEIERGHRFSTYLVHWVRAYIVKYVLNNWGIVRRASLRSSLFFKVRREYYRAIAATAGDVDPARERVAAHLGISTEKVSYLIRMFEEGDVPLDAKVPGVQDGPSILDSLFAFAGKPQDEQLDSAQQQLADSIATTKALASLDARERFIIEQRVMVDDDDDVLTLAEIGLMFGFSRERARQLELRAFDKLRKELGPHYIARNEEAKGRYPNPDRRSKHSKNPRGG